MDNSRNYVFRNYCKNLKHFPKMAIKNYSFLKKPFSWSQTLAIPTMDNNHQFFRVFEFELIIVFQRYNIIFFC